MAKNRLKPNPTSRATLAELQSKRILDREIVGLRHTIRANTGDIDYVGFDLSDLYGNAWMPPLANFHPSVPKVHGRVAYQGGRAELYCTTGRAGSIGDRLDVSAYFPVNQVATNLLLQPCTKNAYFDSTVPMYGDAVLVTDRRAHWVLRPWQVRGTSQEVEEFDGLLTTQRTLVKTPHKSWIFFHEEPCQNDLVALLLRWS